jgi:hypothetical protein
VLVNVILLCRGGSRQDISEGRKYYERRRKMEDSRMELRERMRRGRTRLTGA